MKLEKFIEKVDSLAPFSLQEPWDNSGLQIRAGAEVRRVLLCLEVNEEIAQEAISTGADLIVSHHPMFFTGAKSIDLTRDQGRTLSKLLKNDISLLSCHTSFDKCAGGNNDYMAALLGLEDIGPMASENTVSDDGFARAGNLPAAMQPEELADRVAQALGMDRGLVRLAGARAVKIRRVALCTGAGAEYIAQAAACGCQAFITGDVKHHEVQDAAAMGLCVIDAGHYHTEAFFPDAFLNLFEETDFEDVEFVKTRLDLNPFYVG